MRCASTANLVGAKKRQIYIALNKPTGITCTTEAHVEDNIVELVGHSERIFPDRAGSTRTRKA